jgi:hypothetical protein
MQYVKALISITHSSQAAEGTRVNAFILHPHKTTADACFSRQDLQD